jgi:hypothetical protein
MGRSLCRFGGGRELQQVALLKTVERHDGCGPWPTLGHSAGFVESENSDRGEPLEVRPALDQIPSRAARETAREDGGGHRHQASPQALGSGLQTSRLRKIYGRIAQVFGRERVYRFSKRAKEPQGGRS